MDDFIKVTPMQDNEGHWYIIPSHLSDTFFDELDDENLIEDGGFDHNWGEYRTGGDLNNIQLYATKEDLSNL